MSPTLRIVAAVLATLAGWMLIHAALVEVGASRDRRRYREPCPFDEEEGEAPLVVRIRRIVLEGLAAWVFLLAAPCFLVPRPRQRWAPGDHPPVLFVHGWAGTPGCFLVLRRRLARDGWLHLHHVWLAPVLAAPERNADRLTRAIAKVRERTGAPTVDLVAHSLGGILARLVLHGPAGGSLGRVITLGTPHQGTRAVPSAAHEPALRALAPGSDLLRRLAEATAALPGVECAAIYSVDDGVIRPAEHGYWPGVLNVQVAGPGHNALLVSRRVYDVLRELLEGERPAQLPLAHGA